MTSGTEVSAEMATQPHVVILPFPAKGHSIPVLHFARQLSALGVTITFVNAFHHIAPKDFIQVQGLDKLRVVGLGGLPQPGDEIGPLPMISASERITQDFEELLQELRSTPGLAPPVCILCDMFLGWTQDVANKLGIAKYVLYTSPSLCLSLMAYVPTLQEQGRLPVGTEPFNDIPGVPPTVATDMPSMMLNYKIIPDVYDFFLRNCARLREAKGVLINSYEELEHKSIEGIRDRIYGASSPQGKRSVLPIGPLLPPAYLRQEALGTTSHSTPEHRDHCLQWLDSQPEASVVFISFGSVSSLRDTQITALATGLADSGHKFLYVCRPPAQWDGRDPIDKSLAPSEYLPDGYEGRIHGQGYLVRGWAPQLEILSHPAVGGFLTHCGWNSVLESLCRAVPLLAWPLQAEQRMNSRFLVDEAKAALDFTKGPNTIIEADEVARVVKQLFKSEEGRMVRENASKLRDQAIQAVSPGGSSAKNLELFVDEITSLMR